MLRESLAAGFLVSVLAIPGMTTLLVAQHLHPWETPSRSQLAIVGVWSLAGALVFAGTSQSIAIAIASLGILVTLICRRFLRAYYVSGPILLAITLVSLVVGSAWGISFILSLPISWITRILMLVNGALMVFTLPLGLLTLLPTQSYLFRKRWYRPRHPLPSGTLTSYPKVSFHVPCYAEPPNVVCETLNALSRMQYPNFEVIVVDNNTKDPSLWKPLEQHCAALGERFRFFHVDPLSGAKAGALNFALTQTDPATEIVANIDADYVAAPDFLERLVGFFDDPNLGFVQTPHDYRSWFGNSYQRACYWEYVPNYRLGIASLSEWVASYIIGTMCLVRKSALEEAGGWAEWCLTEDSECAIRIHALGYSSIFLPQTFGRGLIPENFHGYKKQRFRWAVGPIQQLKKHWRLFLPTPFAAPSKLTFWQRVFEFSHSLQESNTLIALVMLPFGLSTLSSILYHQELIIIPSVVWISIAVTIPSSMTLRWLSYRLVGCYSAKDMFGATLASLSLVHIRMVASLTGWFSLKPPKWERTSKFKALPNQLQALKSASVESLLAILFLSLGCVLAFQSSFAQPDILAMITFGLIATGLAYLSAPIMAILAEYQLKQEAHPSLLRPTFNHEFHADVKVPLSSKR